MRISRSCFPCLTKKLRERYVDSTFIAGNDHLHGTCRWMRSRMRLQRSVAMQNARGILVRKQQKMSGPASDAAS